MKRKCSKRLDFSDNPIMEVPELYEAALDEFAKKSFAEASLNDIIKRSGLSKGSFYYRFCDKLDLYLCLIAKIGADKREFQLRKLVGNGFPTSFFAQFKEMARIGIDYARHEPRYYEFWRKVLAENPEIREQITNSMPEMVSDGITAFLSPAIENGQFNTALPKEFLVSITEILISNFDRLITAELSDDDMLKLVDSLALFMETGLARR